MRFTGGSAIAKSIKTSAASGRSWILRTYAILALALIVAIVLLVVLAIPTWIAASVDMTAIIMLAPALLVLVGLIGIGLIFAPLYAVATRFPVAGSDRTAETVYGALGYLIVAGLYLGVVVTVPTEYQSEPSPLMQPIVDYLYALEWYFGFIPPLLAFGLFVAVDQFVYD